MLLLPALVYVGVQWTIGFFELRAVRARLAAAGVSTDPLRFAPVPRTEVENGFAPLAVSLAGVSRDPVASWTPPPRWGASGRLVRVADLQQWPTPRRTDLWMDWTSFFPRFARVADRLPAIRAAVGHPCLVGRWGYAGLGPQERAHLPVIRQAGLILTASVVAECAHGNAGRACADAACLLELVGHLESDPDIEAAHLGQSLLSAAWLATWQILSLDEVAPGGLERLRQGWTALMPVEHARRAMATRLALGTAIERRLRENPRELLPLLFSAVPGGPGAGWSTFPTDARDLRDFVCQRLPAGAAFAAYPYVRRYAWSGQDLARFLELASADLALLTALRSGRPWSELRARAEPSRDGYGMLGLTGDFKHAVSHRLLNGVDAEPKRALVAEAQRRVALVAIALRTFTARHGAPPDSLLELVPGALARLPTDPGDGRPLRYRRVGAGFVLSSVGVSARAGDAPPSAVPAAESPLQGEGLVWLPPAASPAEAAELEAARLAHPDLGRRR